MKKSIFSVFVISLFVAALTPVAAAEKEFVTLNGEQIKRVFSDAYDVQLPEDGAGWSGADWLLTFQPDGTWEATTYEAWGNWRVEGKSLCVALVGGNTQWNAPYEGCLGVKVNVENGVIAASIPKMKLRHFVMKEGAYGELASLKPAPQTSEKAVSSKKLPVRQPAAPPKDDARERALEEQRLALERQRLELEKQKLEMQRQALLFKQQQRQQQ
ncbi:MAG: hypothetical protein OXR03_26265 [Rhodospirillaceae bacterium]|nr:hypothetical protein [Rhodospirillaceae bacterium]MDD9929348.1 hypothetical protein [Rhodospirillaceae bacterium]